MGAEKIKPKMGIRQLQEDNSILEMYLYGDIGPGYYDWWTDTYHEENSAEMVKNKLNEFNQVKEINVYINSYGGDVFEGTAIANQLRRSKAKVNVFVDGFACSVASVIAMAGDKVYMPKNAVMMLHNMWTVVSGNANELRKIADDLDILMEANKTIYLEKAGDKITEDELSEMIDDETWLTAEQCLAYGFCDEVTSQVKLDEKIIDNASDNITEKIQRMQHAKQVIDEIVAAERIVDIPDEPKEKNYLETFFA